jgi:uncharacterized protein (DUF2235 family)
MPKRLVLCCDGTWNTPDQESPTNVTKVALQVASQDPDGREQRVFYNRGVGTDRWERVRGGAFGFGLSRDVRNIYRFLVETFEPGDELFFFGFSRGAFTARSTAGLIRNCGILRREYADRVNQAYALYRSRNPRKKPNSIESAIFRRSYSHETYIRFIGVWDTVGALGIPSKSRLVKLINSRWEFHNTDLSRIVNAAFQALAIDEKRRPFEPTLWKSRKDAERQRLEQVWFAGVHCDVGGGNKDPELAEIPLLWMVDRARDCGLAFQEGAFISRPPDGADKTLRNMGSYVHPDPMGRIDESRRSFYKLQRPFVRKLGVVDDDGQVTDDPSQHVASSAVERHKRNPDEYSPPGLVEYLDRPHQIMQVSASSGHRLRGSVNG